MHKTVATQYLAAHTSGGNTRIVSVSRYTDGTRSVAMWDDKRAPLDLSSAYCGLSRSSADVIRALIHENVIVATSSRDLAARLSEYGYAFREIT